MSGFRYLLALENGDSADPAAFVTAVPDWWSGMTFVASTGQLFKILGVEAETEADESPERMSLLVVGRRRAQRLIPTGTRPN